jgi:DMSO/TMAO reductase YedYZ molybdopterin-dependent catalytic subunit
MKGTLALQFGLSLVVVLLVLGGATGCAATQIPATPTPVTVTPDTIAQGTPTPCILSTIVAPTPPAEIPGYAELDPTTGLHVTGLAQEIELETYRLEITGRVDHPLTLSYDDLRCMPKVEDFYTLICPGVFTDMATWGGVPLKHILELAGVAEDAAGIKLVSADGYVASVDMSMALSESSLLAYEWEGEPLPVLHGFPVRAVFPPLPGNKWVKWLVRIEVY